MSSYSSHFNTKDGTTDALIPTLGVPKQLVLPRVEGVPYKVGDWDGSDFSFKNTVGYDFTIKIDEFVKIPISSYFNFTIYDADDTTPLFIHTTQEINNNLEETTKYIKFKCYNYTSNSVDKKANIEITFYISALLPKGGRFTLNIEHVTEDGVFTFNQTLFYNPTANVLSYVPKNLQKTTIYPYISELIDWVNENYHTKYTSSIENMYNVNSPDFDPDYMLRLFNFPLEDIFGTVEEDVKKTICLFISKIFSMKGTKKSLNYILSILNLEATIYEWYFINDQRAKGIDPAYYYKDAPQCSIWLNFGIIGNYPIDDDFEAKLISLVKTFLWVCVFIDDIAWTKILVDTLELEDTQSASITDRVFLEYSPYKMNCSTLIYGPPIIPDLPYYGKTGLVFGDSTLFTPEEDYEEINYNGSDTHHGYYGRAFDTYEYLVFGSSDLVFGGFYDYHLAQGAKRRMKYGLNPFFSHVSPGTRLYGKCVVSYEETIETITLSNQLGITSLFNYEIIED